MKAQIDTLKRDIEIHKEVEKELAKRSHFCQKVIKRLRLQVKDLESQNQDLFAHKKPEEGEQVRDHPSAKNNEDLINYLEHRLEEIEKKCVSTQSEYEVLQNDYMELQDKLNLSREKYKRAALLLTDFLDDLLSNTPNILQNDNDLFLNLDKM